MKNNNGDLRVWWIPQVPMKPFYVTVKTVNEAILIVETLADYDRFQFENGVKGDYANTGGLEIFEDGEWVEWYNGDGDDLYALFGGDRMTTLNDVKVGDTVFLDWCNNLGYVEVVRLTNTQIVVRLESGNEYRFHKKNGDIAHGGHDDTWLGKPKISVRTIGTDWRFALQEREKKRRLMINKIRAVRLDKLSSEQLERILVIIDEEVKE